jgi:hypothetical protein
MLKKFEQMMKGMMPGNSKGMRSLGQAGRAMDGAARSLGQGQPGPAVGQQGQALEALRRAGQGMMQQMMSRFGRGSGIGMNPQFNPMGTMRDPLGRDWLDEEGNNGDGQHPGRFKIPGGRMLKRVMDIQDELRKRLGERDRPDQELDYIERLLKRF